MKSFKEFITEAFDAKSFQEKANTLPGLTHKSWYFDAVGFKGGYFEYITWYPEFSLLGDVFKGYAKEKGLLSGHYYGNGVYVTDKDKKYQIELGADSSNSYKLLFKIRFLKQIKDSDANKAIAIAKGLLKALEKRIKELKKYAKIVDMIQDISKKTKIFYNDMMIKGYFHEGQLLDITVTPPSGYSKDVDDFFNEDFYNLLNKKVAPAAAKLGIRDVAAARSASGNGVIGIKGLDQLKYAKF